MTNLQRAAVFLAQARDMIEEDARYTEEGDRRDDLKDIAEDLGQCLYHLESNYYLERR